MKIELELSLGEAETLNDLIMQGYRVKDNCSHLERVDHNSFEIWTTAYLKAISDESR